MPRYALLPAPSANRVYAASALDLARSELAVLDHHRLRAGNPDRHHLVDLGVTALGGVRYLTFATSDGAPLSGDELGVVGSLSSAHALFAVEGREGDELLRPLGPGGTFNRWDDDLITIPRYAGRTNDQFTALLVNLATATARTATEDRRLRVLDPVCGRGTTINQAVMVGHDAAGVDIDGRDSEAWAAFFTTWLKDKRIKHGVARIRLRRSRATGPGVRITVSLWADKEAQRRRNGQEVVMIADDTLTVSHHLGHRSVDAIAGDLPYGVAHGSRTGGARGAGDPAVLSRRPGDLVAEALPVWRDVLRPGGTMALAWNVRTMDHDAMAAAVAAAGLEQVALPEGASFLHRVDRTITRDAVLARRPD